ncbi:GDP-mannose 4,6-dehydratase [Pleomorphochaeta sp. DL1XJH-081]|uniref:GDP-mannose 4,6-dehydratase n=1 Tax=Pleomorphochaeta sp. DL1XJH-081 TaxID=3409690 RepID=UPI003BB7412C
MSTVLVTGGAGFIGSHVCEALLRRGDSVVALDNFNDFYDPKIKRSNVHAIRKTTEEQRGSFALEEGDIRDNGFLAEAFDRHEIDAVIHLAAYAGVRPSIENPQLYTEVNVLGTTNLLEMMKTQGIKRHVFASSSSVYGNNRKIPFSEKDPVDKAISPYAATKKAGEVICYTYHHLYGINTACLRFFTVYGPRQRPDLAIHKFTKLILAGQPIPFYGDGSMKRDFTYIDDIVDGVLKALDWTNATDSRYKIFNLGNSTPMALSELVKAIEEVVGKNAIIKRLPQPPGDVDCTYADITQAKEILGYCPKFDTASGLKNFYVWLTSTQTGK